MALILFLVPLLLRVVVEEERIGLVRLRMDCLVVLVVVRVQIMLLEHKALEVRRPHQEREMLAVMVGLWIMVAVVAAVLVVRAVILERSQPV
jgi:hypothetical protein